MNIMKNNKPKIKIFTVRLFVGIPTITFLCALITGIAIYELFDLFFPYKLETSEQFEKFQKYYHILFSGLLSFSFLVGLMIAHYIVSSLKKIQKDLMKIIKGKDTKLETDAYDEIGELKNTCNLIVEHLKENFLKEEKIFEGFNAAVLVVNAKMEVTFLNNEAKKLFEYKGGYPISLNKLIPMAKNSIFYYLLGDLKSHKKLLEKDIEIINIRDKKIFVSVSGSAIEIEGKNSFILTFKNLNEINNLRKQMLLAEQLAIVGGLSAGISHEIKNPLGSIRGLLQLLEEELENKNKYSDYFKRIYSEIERINNVIKNVLDFSQAQDINFSRFDINDLLKEILHVLQAQFKEKEIKVLTNFYSELPLFLGDKDKLYSAFFNVIKNAFELMDPLNTISVKTALAKVKPFISKYSFLTKENSEKIFFDKKGIIVEISNTGTHIDNRNIDKIFRPFYSKKNKGTGLGLALAKQVINAHCGNIDVNSEYDKVTFRIELPFMKIKSQEGKEYGT